MIMRNTGGDEQRQGNNELGCQRKHDLRSGRLGIVSRWRCVRTGPGKLAVSVHRIARVGLTLF